MIFILIVLLGLALGSFVNALIWRVHEAESLKGKNKTKKTPNMSILNGRSMCIHCKHTLAWYDLIPVLSWLQLRGKCRYCHKKIDDNPLVELMLGILLTLSFYFWPFRFNSTYDYILFGVWALILTILLALVVYDLKWMILPTKLVMVALFLTALYTLITALNAKSFAPLVSSLVGSFGMGGLFWIIYQLSKGKWIGGGDVRLGFVLGLLLGWQKTMLGLTLAAYIGLAIIIALAVIGKYQRRMKLPFGPMLIAGAYISMLWGQYFIDLYKGLSGL